ncbi:hypothetical protein [Candidatus Sulfurimonas baltica]|uniref:Uncharacterized protein n=1 Tax=Candidatus Sulfurimonas baltica TaxID=2740404 RepID=A0A7S7RM51_9BACT|nr:hypothetical protein [Candidatus Sulfurimonas baltica]QOY50955.1 hypothetical protein HUE88_07300 [Candidatus Sulfurimonas baltica]
MQETNELTITRQEAMDAIGKVIPSRHTSFFIIPIPHGVFDGIVDKKNFQRDKTTSKIYNNFFVNGRGESFVKVIKGNGWEFLNESSKEKKPGYEDIKEYIYTRFFSQYNEETKSAFFHNKNNMIFQKQQENTDWKLKLDSHDINFKMDSLQLWILDNNIAFLVLETSLHNTHKIADISSVFNQKMRDFIQLNIDFKEKIVVYSSANTDFLKTLFKSFSTDQFSGDELFNIDLEHIDKTNKYHAIYKSAVTAKMISMTHINEDGFEKVNDTVHCVNAKERVNDTILIQTPVTNEIKYTEINSIDYMSESTYALATFSSFNSEEWLSESSESYIYEKISNSSYSPFKYWNALALKDSLTFLGIREGNDYYFNEGQKNEVFLIYMLNLYINYNIKIFEQKLIDSEFTDIDRHNELYKQMQRLKNEYFSSEVARRFQPNELNIVIQKGMGYLDVYNEVENNIAKTLDITRDNIANTLKVLGTLLSVILLFGDDIKNTEIFKYTMQLITSNVSISGAIALVTIILSIKYKRVAYVKSRQLMNFIMKSLKSY